jgi:hypothetical protein
VAQRSIRDFQVPFEVAPIADAWASANGFALDEVELDGSRHYVRGSGLLTGQMMCVVRQSGQHVRVEGFIHARLAARIGALFLIPENKSIAPGGIVGVLPRTICRDAVNKLLAQLGQPPITAADDADPAAGAVQPSAPVAAPQPGAPAPPAAPTTAPRPGTPTKPAMPNAGSPVAPGYRAAAARPFGIVLLVIVEVVTALICLSVASDFWYWFGWRARFDEMDRAAVDLVVAVGYLAIAGGSAAVAWRLWSMRRDAWLAAIALSAGVLAITVISSIIWDFEARGILGIVVHTGAIGYLNLTPTRALFGRGPLVAASTSN